MALAPPSLWDTIADEAAGESPLWQAAVLPDREREPTPVFSPLAAERYALGLETIYEGYLLHYGLARLFAPADRDASVLLGDYLYAHGLVRIAALGEVEVVADLAELLSLCAQLRAAAVSGEPVADGVVWAATVALLGRGDERLSQARASLRDEGDAGPLADLAMAETGADRLERALALHAQRIS
jgi:hypothetical protein